MSQSPWISADVVVWWFRNLYNIFFIERCVLTHIINLHRQNKHFFQKRCISVCHHVFLNNVILRWTHSNNWVFLHVDNSSNLLTHCAEFKRVQEERFKWAKQRERPQSQRDVNWNPSEELKEFLNIVIWFSIFSSVLSRLQSPSVSFFFITRILVDLCILRKGVVEYLNVVNFWSAFTLLPTVYRHIACFSSHPCLRLILWKVVSPSFSRSSSTPSSCR